MRKTKIYGSPEVNIISVDYCLNSVLCSSVFSIDDYGSETINFDEE